MNFPSHAIGTVCVTIFLLSSFHHHLSFLYFNKTLLSSFQFLLLNTAVVTYSVKYLVTEFCISEVFVMLVIIYTQKKKRSTLDMQASRAS